MESGNENVQFPELLSRVRDSVESSGTWQGLHEHAFLRGWGGGGGEQGGLGDACWKSPPGDSTRRLLPCPHLMQRHLSEVSDDPTATTSSLALQVSASRLAACRPAPEEQLSPLLAGCDTYDECPQFPRGRREVAPSPLPAGSLQSGEGGRSQRGETCLTQGHTEAWQLGEGHSTLWSQQGLPREGDK